MRTLCLALWMAAAVFVAFNLSTAQTPQDASSAPATEKPAPALERLLGEVKDIDTGSKRLTLKTTAGAELTLTFDEQTLYRRVRAGETSLDKASAIAVEEISRGDKVLARVKLTGQTMLARLLIVVSRSDIVEKKEQERSEWQRRGITGTIAALDPQAREITLNLRADGNAPAQLIISAGNEALRFRRYAPDSILFSDALPSSFDDLRVGDTLRARGQKNAEGTRYIPEEIIAGSFRMIGGTIASLDVEKNEITINDIQTRQPLTIVINKGTQLRRLSDEIVKLLEERAGAKTAPAISNGQTSTVPSSSSPTSGEELYSLIDNLPPISVRDLKPGEALLVSSTKGANPSRVTAVMVAAGVDSFLKRRMQHASRQGFTLDLSLPGITP